MARISVTLNLSQIIMCCRVLVADRTVKTLITLGGTVGALQSGVVISPSSSVFFHAIKQPTLFASNLHAALGVGYINIIERDR